VRCDWSDRGINYDECGGTLTQTWTFTDACGRSIEHVQTITVEPAPEPVFIDAPADATISCTEALTYAATAIQLSYSNAADDACLIEGSVTGVIDANYNECGGSITQTWTFTDLCGRVIEHTQTITVEPAPEPVFIDAPADATISCTEALTYAATAIQLSYSNAADDACLIEGSVTGVIDANYNECGGSITQTWTFTDLCGRVIEHTQTITVEPAPEPVFIDAPADATISCTEALTYAATAIQLSYSNAADDACLIEGSVTGVIDANYNECGGSITQTWTFTDLCGRVIEHTQTITVEPAPEPVFIDAPADATISCTEALTYAATAIQLSYSNAADDACLIEGSVTGVIDANYNECGGSITQTWTFTDACGRSIEHVQTITVEPAPEPVFIDAPADATISCTEALTYAATAIQLSYSNAADDACLIEGSVTGVIDANYNECGGSITQTWSFTDLCGRVIEHTQTITVEPAPEPVFIDAPADATISCTEALTYAATAIQLSYSNAADDACLIEGSVTGVIDANYNECGGSITQTWTFTDLCGRVIEHTQTITVEPAPEPVFIDAPADATISCTEALTYAATAIQLSYSNAADDACLIEGSVTGVIDANYNECGGSITQTWTFTDLCGRVIEHTQTITVEPAPEPVFIDAPADATISCTEALTYAATAIQLSYSNAADDACLIEGSVTGVIDANYNECGGSITQTWTFTDLCGRVIEHTQTITVEPAPEPVFIDAPADATISCTEALTYAATAIQLSYSNAADDACLIEGSVTGVIDANYNECGGSITQTWSFTDLCGRVIEHTQTITVEPAPEPVFIDAPEDATISCTEALTYAATAIQLSYSNAADDACLIEGSVTGVIDANYNECGGSITQTWTFTDLCGRVIEHTFRPLP
jgi:hypothetical protein